MYKNGITFPTFLFFQNDFLKINNSTSIKDLIESNKKICFDDVGFFQFNLNHIIQGANFLETIKTLLVLFPYLKFSASECIEISVKSNYIDLSQINNLFSERVDLSFIEDLVCDIEENKSVDYFDEQLFYTNLYKVLYKLFFIDLSSCFKLTAENDFRFNIKQELEKYKEYENSILNKECLTENKYDICSSYVVNFRKSLKPNSNVDVYNKLLDLNKYVEDDNKGILDFIFDCVKLNEQTTTSGRNKILRDLYWKLGRKILRKSFLIYDSPNSPSFVKEFSKISLRFRKK